jgi:hypothetical protein
MNKRTVRYDTRFPIAIVIGLGALVKPIDHYDSEWVSNEKMVFTSPVISANEDGSFETVNSLYVPVQWS